MSEVRGSRLLKWLLGSVPSGVAAVLVVLLVASGCGGDDQREPTAPAPAEEPTGGAEEPTEPEELEEEVTEPAEPEEEVVEPAEPEEEVAAPAEPAELEEEVAEPAEPEEEVAEPEEPAELEEEVAEPAAVLEGLVVSRETTVADLLDRLPSEDRDCVRDRFGDSEYETLGATTLAGLFLDLAAAERLLECFEVENSRGLALIEAQEGGLTPATRGCLVALSYDHPELFALRIGVPLDALETDHLEAHQMFLDIVDCMAPLEQMVLTARIRLGLVMADPVELRDVTFFYTEDEASCMSRIFDDWDALLDTPPEVAFTRPGIHEAEEECFGPKIAGLYDRIAGANMLALLSGVGSQESLDCLVDFFAERPGFLAGYANFPYNEFMVTGDPAVFEANLDLHIESVQDGILLLDCLPDDELRRFQQRIPSALAAFQSHRDSSG